MLMTKARILTALLGLASLCVACEERDTKKSGIQTTSATIIDEQTSALFAEANRALIDEDPARAITLCTQGLEEGDVACHRLLGTAYKQQKNKPLACASFKRALEVNDPHALTIERYVKHLRCDVILPAP